MRIEIALLIGILLPIPVAFAVGPADDSKHMRKSDNVSEVRLLDKILENLKSLIPSEKYQCAVTEIQKSVNPSTYANDSMVGEGNSGLNRFYNNFLESNSCFAGVASKFWTQMNTELTIANTNSTLNPAASTTGFAIPSLAETGRPTLGERAGQGRFANLKPGFLWQRALTAAKNDPNAAAMLIGMCTHDDIATQFSAPSDPESQREYLRNEINRLNKVINETKKALQNINKDSEEFKYFSDDLIFSIIKEATLKENLEKDKFPKFVSQSCPLRNSASILPGSLGELVDIPQALKNEIAFTQKPGGSLSDLPAKAYHFTGGMMVGCQLGKCGLSPSEAEAAAGIIANGYRSVRICSTVQLLLKQQESIFIEANDAYRVDAPDFPEKAKKYLIRQYTRRLTNETISADIEAADLESANKRAEAKLAELDAARLFNRWYLGTTGACSTVRTGGPKNLMASDQTQRPDPNTGVRRGGTVCDIPGWSLDRCEKARKKLATWDVDFKWTAAQHRIGARFGAEQCKPDRTPAADFDKKFCSDNTAGSSNQNTNHRPASQ